jgi:hypothetical protein
LTSIVGLFASGHRKEQEVLQPPLGKFFSVRLRLQDALTTFPLAPPCVYMI